MEQPGIVILVILVMAFFVGWHLWATNQRRKELSAWAAAKGLRFDPDRDGGLDDRFPHFKCLRRGHSRHARNVMRGELDGTPITAFDYHYTTGHGKNRRTHRFSAVIVTSDLPLLPLLIRPENLLDKVGEFFGADDIDFESAEFSRKFFVKAQDKKWAYDVIHQQTMEYLLTAPSFSIQFDRSEIIVWRGSRFSPDQFTAAVGVVRGLLARLPDYVVQRQRELGQGSPRKEPGWKT